MIIGIIGINGILDRDGAYYPKHNIRTPGADNISLLTELEILFGLESLGGLRTDGAQATGGYKYFAPTELDS